MTLTAKRVAKVIRKGEPGRHLDSRGLYLITQSPTAAHWEKRYQLDGKEHYHGLGSAFTFSLAEARVRNRRASQLLEDGVDPLAAKREAKAQRIAAAARTVSFGEAATDYYRAHSPGWGHAKHIAQWRASVLGLTMTGKPTAHDYCKPLRALPVAQIDTPVVLHVLKPLWHDKPETMSRVRARVASVLDYAKAAGYRQGDNPASWAVIGKLLPSRNKINRVEHFEAVDYHAVPAFVATLRKREGMAARALEFLIYTAARTTEVLHAQRAEIDIDKALWTIPAERMKADKEHRVPLTPPVLELLAQLPREAGSDFLFLGSQPGKPWSATALVSIMRRMGRTEVPHGFRSSFSDWAHETTAYPSHVIEQALAHTVGSAVKRAYQRGDLLAKRKQLMTAWAKYCTSPAVQTAEGKIVPMGRGRS
jgi:integrase